MIEGIFLIQGYWSLWALRDGGVGSTEILTGANAKGPNVYLSMYEATHNGNQISFRISKRSILCPSGPICH